MYIWIQLLTATLLLSINYDENIILSWMNLELKAECMQSKISAWVF